MLVKMGAVWRLVYFVELLTKAMENVLAVILALDWRMEVYVLILEN